MTHPLKTRGLIRVLTHLQERNQNPYVGDDNQDQADKCFDGLGAFYMRTYCVGKLPLNDLLLEKCFFVDFRRLVKVSFDYKEEYITRFTKIHNKMEEEPFHINRIRGTVPPVSIDG